MDKFIQQLRDFVAIQSVSTDPRYAKEIEKAVQYLKRYATSSGLSVEIIRGFDNPIIIARTPSQKDLKTILVYGHYDVQPAERSEGWKSDPFVLTRRNGRLYGRGAADNKGQILIHLYSVGELLRTKDLGFNVVFMVEGNEETGSPNLLKFLKANKRKLNCDCIVISDGELAHQNKPALEAGFRGVANLEVELVTARDDAHSGLFGGVIPNAVIELSRILGQIHDANGEILIPGFYQNTKILSDKLSNGISRWAKEILKLTGTKKVFAKNRFEYEHKTGLRPAIEVTGFSAGYTGVGFRNSIPAKAKAKINIRSAPGQDPEKLAKKLEKFVIAQTPDHSEVRVSVNEATFGAVLDCQSDFAGLSCQIAKVVYGSEPTFKYSGGTLPIVNHFDRVLGVPQVMIPLANVDCGMHSASENISIVCLRRGIKFSKMFFGKK